MTCCDRTTRGVAGNVIHVAIGRYDLDASPDTYEWHNLRPEGLEGMEVLPEVALRFKPSPSSRYL